VPDLSEPDERLIRQYVESQSADDPVTLVQSVGSQRILVVGTISTTCTARKPGGGSSPIPPTSTNRATFLKSIKR